MECVILPPIAKPGQARMAELVDAADSKFSRLQGMQVRFPRFRALINGYKPWQQ